jgi:aryl-alcohol dehydrogenase-like predicted oxidoreductase
VTIPRVGLGHGYTIPRLVIGGWQLATGHSTQPPDPETVYSVWDRLVERGADTFDCADIYGGVEQLLGAYRSRRDQRGLPPIQVHTKLVPDRSTLSGLSRQAVERAIDRSLARLRLERLDLVQFHWWDYDVPGYLDAFRWLGELRLGGKIRHLGLTNFDTVRVGELLGTEVPIVSIQAQYSVLDRRPSRSLARLCLTKGIGLLCYGTVAGGFLSERWHGRPDPGSTVENRSLTKYRLIIDEAGGWDAFQRLLGVLAEIARKHGTTVGNVGIRAVLDWPAVAATIVGVRTDAHLADLARVLELSLDDEDRARIDQVLGPDPGPPGDVYQAERVPGGIHAGIIRTESNRDGPVR